MYLFLRNTTQTVFNTACCTGRAGIKLIVPFFILTTGLAGCSSFSTSSLPSFGFGFGSGASSQSPDCEKIEKQMRRAHRQYAAALGQEKPAIYLTFTGNLSRTMSRHRLAGLYQMTDRHLDGVIDRTRNACVMGNLDRADCAGAYRLGRAYKSLVLVSRKAHENYCGNRPIR